MSLFVTDTPSLCKFNLVCRNSQIVEAGYSIRHNVDTFNKLMKLQEGYAIAHTPLRVLDIIDADRDRGKNNSMRLLLANRVADADAHAQFVIAYGYAVPAGSFIVRHGFAGVGHPAYFCVQLVRKVVRIGVQDKGETRGDEQYGEIRNAGSKLT